MNPAIYFEPDAYALDGPRLMGRQSAGNGFLRAAVHAHAGQLLHALTPQRSKAERFWDLVRAIDPAAQARWIPASRLDLVAERGLLYRPDANLATHARERLRVGPAAYSLCGVTHTLCTHAMAEVTAELVTQPVMPWDALVCTSTAARAWVETVLQAEAEQLAWRLGHKVAAPRPQLPVIPLGVHTADFAFGEAERAAARAALGLDEAEVAALFVGRLTFNAKAHPYQMYAGLEAAARAGAERVVLLQAGQSPGPAIEQAFRSAAAQFCPGVRVVWVDGQEAARVAQAWRAADLFVSLSDNYQETFGLTPIEAMAAGLPVLVSDWNGYKDTVRDGVDGFRIPSWAPQAGLGASFAADFETGATNFDYFLSRTSTTVSVDFRVLVERLGALLTRPELRRRLGANGQARAREAYDWAVVYRAYQALWRELAAIRARAAGDPALRLAEAPREAATRLDPFRAFAHYPTAAISGSTPVRLRAGASVAAYEALTTHPMFTYWRMPADEVGRTLETLGGGAVSVAEVALALGEAAPAAVERVARLAKMGLVELGPAQAEA